MCFGKCVICGEETGNSATSTIEGFSHPACHDKREAARPREEVITELRDQLSAVWRRLRELSECPNCRWPMPPDNDHDICPCCSFQVSYNVVEGYQWDGEWWFRDSEHGRPPAIVERLQSKTTAQSELLRRIANGGVFGAAWLVAVAREAFEPTPSADAVDPHLQDSGPTTPRAEDSSSDLARLRAPREEK